MPLECVMRCGRQAGFPGVLDGAGKTVCYNFSLTASQVREVVWWTTGRVAFYLEPCAGKPHMKISIYGCPSQGGGFQHP
eukprot:486829-Hanusia_phi.AAC.2